MDGCHFRSKACRDKGAIYIVATLLLFVGPASGKSTRLEYRIEPFQQNTGSPVPPPGRFVNCGNASTEFSITWQPPKFRFGDTVSVKVHFVPLIDMGDGYVNGSVYQPGQPDPIYIGDGKYTCEDIDVYVKYICPFYKNKAIDFERTGYVRPDLPLVPGDYLLKMRIYALNGNELLCVFGHVVMLDD